jgi:hypothetical protein
VSDFWSRRRAAVASEARAEVQADEATARAEREAALAEKTDDELLAELDLPDPDSVEDTETLKAFWGEAVPQRLKTRAMRRLWRLNPVLANLDGLIDYGEDFTDAATVVENLQTTYQVGKGMLAHVEALAAKAQAEAEAAARAAAETDGETDAVADDAPVEAVEPPAEDVEPPVVAAASTHAPLPEIAPDHPLPPQAPRRMSFRFETGETA